MSISKLIEQLEIIKLHYGDNFEVKMRVDDDMQFGEEFGDFDVEVRNDGVVLVAELVTEFSEEDQ